MKNTALVLLFACLFCLDLHAQERLQPSYTIELEKADLFFKAKKYNTAALLYQKVYPKIKESESRDQTLFKIAESYRYSNNFSLAIKWYENLINSKYPDPQVLFNYAQLIKNFEKYEDAIRVFNDFLFEMPGNKNALEAIAGCKMAMEWKAKPARYMVKNLSTINTPYSDYGPYSSKQQLYFSSSRKEAQGSGIFEWTGQKYADIFSSNLVNGKYSAAIPEKNLNSNYNEGAVCMDSAQNIYFTQCNGPDGNGLNCKIYISYLNGNQYATPQILPFNNDSFSCGHPAWDPQNKFLYFSSDKTGGYGKKDIWRIQYNYAKNTWSEAENLGTTINTDEDELFPSFDKKGNLYFSSKGHLGMGGLDIYKSINIGQDSVQNLGSPINSGADDLGISWTGDSTALLAYFSSNRQGGIGDDDLYAIYSKPFVLTLNGTVIERETEKVITNAQIEILDQNQKNVLTLKTDEMGQFTTDLSFGKQYQLKSTKNNYLTAGLSLSPIFATNDSSIQVVLLMDFVPAKEAELTVQGIYYDLDQWDIRKDAQPILDSLASVLQLNPGLEIELASHTDSRADAAYNIELSNKRAKSCVNYLVNNGIQASRMKAVGYGEQFLVNDCKDGVDCSETEHQANRRTTIKFLKTDTKIKVR